MTELLLAAVGYYIFASLLVPAAGWVADDLGMEPREARWAAVQAVTIAPAALGIIALWLVYLW